MPRKAWFVLVFILAYQPGAQATGQSVSEAPSLALRAGAPKVTEIPAVRYDQRNKKDAPEVKKD